jgi:hypothetical protein
MKYFIFLFIALLAVLFTGCSGSQVASSEKEADKAAAKSLKTFSRLITKENYVKMGFKSLDEVKKAKLDNSIRDYMIELSSLKEYREGTNPERLLIRMHSLVYPVLVDGEARTSLTVAYRESRWEAHSFGYSNFTKLLAVQLNELSKNQRLPRSAFFIVRVPALNLVFLGYRTKEKIMLISVLDATNYDISVGVPVPAGIVLTKLRSAAQKCNDLPR